MFNFSWDLEFDFSMYWNIQFKMLNFLNIVLDQKIKPVIFLGKIGKLTLNFRRNDCLSFLNGLLDLLNVVLCILKIFSNLCNLLVEPIDLLHEYDNPKIPLTQLRKVLILRHAISLGNLQPSL